MLICFFFSSPHQFRIHSEEIEIAEREQPDGGAGSSFLIETGK